MWSHGTMDGYTYWIKHYDNASEFGLDGGRISKLTIRKAGETKDLCRYDRGWDVAPAGEAKAVYDKLLSMYN